MIWIEWSCVEDGTKALQGKKTSESWTEWADPDI